MLSVKISATRTPMSCLDLCFYCLVHVCVYTFVCTMNILSSFIIGLSMLCNTQTVHKTYTMCKWLNSFGFDWYKVAKYV